MNNQSLITVVTTTKNRKELLERLIKSIVEQDYSNIEHVVVDAASTDGTIELLKSYETKYNLHWISEPDKNQTEGVNKGLVRARGEFVTITHDDDYWIKDGIAALMQEFFLHPELDLVYGDSYELFPVRNSPRLNPSDALRAGAISNGVYPDGTKIRSSYGQYTLSDMVNGGYQIPQHGCIFRSAILKKTGFLDEKLHHVAEYELFLRMIEAGGKYKYVPTTVGVGLQHEKKESWVWWNRSWDETWAVNRRHGGKLFSKFTFIYIQNRYFKNQTRFIKNRFPSLFRVLKQVLRTPSYHK